jgi:methylthioribose-1-phosphate isomerase
VIVVERRTPQEVTFVAETAVASAGGVAYDPAFDVTPPSLVTAIVTENDVLSPVDAAGIGRMSAGHNPVMRR